MNLTDLQKVNVGDKKAAQYIDTLYDDTVKQYLKLHRNWYINERFARGDHWVVYNKTLNKVQAIPVTEGEIRRTVNKVKAQIRGVKNFVKSNQPRWEVHPSNVTNEAFAEAIKQNKILQNIYRTRRIPLHLTDVITNSLKFSVGILEGGLIQRGGKNYLDFWVDDTFDVFFDPLAPSVQKCRYIIKAFKKPINSIKNNPNYTVKGDLRGGDEETATQYKDLLDMEKYGSDKVKSSEDLESTMVREVWIKWNDETGKPFVRVLTTAGGQLIRVYEPNYRRYPIFSYNPERDANAIYSNAWIKDLISMNKSLDKSVSQVEGYIQRMLAGKYLIKQGVEVSSITDKGAEKIYYKGSTAPVQQNLQPLPSTPFTYIQGLERWIEELGGIREASLGRAPSSVQSGKGIEALQAADAQTVAEPIENLEMFLADVGEFILEVIADNQLVSEEIIEENEKIKFIGDVKNAPEDAIQINSSQVKVAIVPEISYNEENRREWLIRLAEAGIVDEQTLLEKLSISNVGDIIARVKKNKEEKFKEEMVKQKESHRSDGDAPEDTADLADQENMAMAASQIPPMTPQALWTPEHLELHMIFIQQNQDAYEQAKDIFDDHIANEQQYGS
jgi:hypothetical protein